MRAGSSYLVGEKGPEVLTMGGNGFITPNGAGAGGHSISITQNFHGATSAADVRRAGGAVAREVLGALSSARRYS